MTQYIVATRHKDDGLNVKLFFLAPPMVRLPQDYEEGLLLEQNEPMRLKVSVSGRPLPQVTWLHDGEEIRGGDR